jgi:hypothetical protein
MPPGSCKSGYPYRKSEIQNITENRTNNSFSWFYDFDFSEYSHHLERYISSIELVLSK